MADAPESPRKQRARRSPSRKPARQTPTQPATGPSGVRDRLRRDRFLFLMCLSLLGFVTWAFALTWWVTGAVGALAVALASVAPAIYLFYLRDA